jgi:amino acid adenylation domain-containing protein
VSKLSRPFVDLPPEQLAIRAKCFHPTSTSTGFRIEDIEQSIAERFEWMARKYPAQVAVKTKTHELTYDELNNAANRLANAILMERGEKSEPIALMFEQGAPATVAILGTLKAGKFYVPLDPSLPFRRSEDILLDSTAGMILTNTKNVSKAKILAKDRRQVINIEDVESDVRTKNPELSIRPDAFAYIVYTSGSTGHPKGVVHNHRYVLYHAFEYDNSFHISPADRISLVVSWGFTGGSFIIYSTLLNGASLFPFDVTAEGLENLARLLLEEEITIYHSTPTLFRHLLDVLSPDERLPSLRLIRFGGEPVNKSDVLLYQSRFSRDCLMLNSLAATECGIICRYFVDKDTQISGTSVPVGYVADNKEILLLDDHGDPVDSNQTGEIAVKSRYLSSGYWGRPDLTAAKFIEIPGEGKGKIYLTGDLGRIAADGCLYHLGRKDFRVKIRGYRIELAEVEAALLDHHGVKEATVVSREGQSGNSQLVAYVVPATKLAPRVSDLRKFLKQKLPDHMIPTAFVSLDKLPLTPTGKINRHSLPEPDYFRPELETPFVPARNAIERKLTSIWAGVLSVDRVGIHDDFFDLGGHSLAATRVVSQVIKEFQSEIPLRVLFQSPTVAVMAEVVAKHHGERLVEGELEKILTELESLTEEETQRLLSAASGTREKRNYDE